MVIPMSNGMLEAPSPMDRRARRGGFIVNITRTVAGLPPPRPRLLALAWKNVAAPWDGEDRVVRLL